MSYDNTPNRLESAFVQRDTGNQYYEQVNISGSDLMIYHDETGKITADKVLVWASKYGIGSGGQALSASWASASYQAQYATQSLYATQSVSASVSLTASYLIGGSDLSVSSSWASASLEAQYATQSLYATQSITASFAITASNASTASYLLNYAPTVSASWASASLSASIAATASYSTTASYALNAATATALNGTNPTYKQYAQALTPSSSLTSTDVLSAVFFSSSNARTDGADIRIQWADVNGNPSGSYIPLSIGVQQVSGSPTIFTVYWTDTFVSTSLKKYIITYGDPNAQYMYLTQNQLTATRKRGQMMPGTSAVVYLDNTQADSYTTAQWGTIGIRVSSLTGVDDGTANIALPSPFIYNGVSAQSMSISTNGQFRPTLGAFSGYGIVAPDQWGVNNQDARLTWCDICTNTDGWALQYYNQRALSLAGNYKLILRYQNSGKFKFTIFDSDPSYQANFGSNLINGYSGTTYWTNTLVGVITASNPLSAMCMVLESMASAATSGSEQSYP